MRGVRPRNYRAGELQSWGTAELARSVRFRQGTGTDLRDDRLLHSRIHWDTDPGGTVFGNPRVGPSDPGGKPGAFLSGLPLLVRSRREDHGLNDQVWVLGMGLRLPNYRDSPVAGSAWDQKETGRAATEPGDGGGARRSLMAGHGSAGADGSREDGCRAEACGNVENSSPGPGLLAPGPLTGFRAPVFQAPDSHGRGYRLRRRGPESNRALGQPRDGVTVGFRVGFRRTLRRRGCCNGGVVTRRGCLGMGGYWCRRSGRRSGPMGVA